jgi:comEA protein
MIRRLIDWLALTPTERTVILFLAITLAIGAAIRFYEDSVQSNRKFNYTAVDSTFALFQKQATSDSTRAGTESTSRIIDINAATKAELSGLPGIGSVLADRIIRYREESGGFEAIEDLRKVKGISQKKFEKLKPLIAVQ